MNRSLQLGTLVTGLMLIVILGLLRESDRPKAPRPGRAVQGRGFDPEVAGSVSTPPAPPAAAALPIESILGADNLPQGVLTGPFRAEGPNETVDALAELSLTASQRAIIDALLAERDARHRELQRAAATRDEADRLAAEAQRAHVGCLSSIRNVLFPEQQTRFDALVSSGRWGGYTFLIPHSR